MGEQFRYHFDQAYVERLVAGDPETERHFTAYFDRLLSMKLRARLRSSASVEDAKQETFARVLTTLKNKGGLATPETFGAFVNSVCNNVLFELYRSESRHPQLDEDCDKDQADTSRPSAESILLSAEEQGRVRAALSALSQKERELLTWLFLDERDRGEICRELNVDRNYLRLLLHRAKARFREQYESADELT